MNRRLEIELFEQHEKVTFYAIKYDGETESEVMKFIDLYDVDEYKEDIDLILSWIDYIGENGADNSFFRDEIGNMKAMPLDFSKLRLYCFKITDGIVLLSGGGVKTTATFNEDEILNFHAMNILGVGRILMSLINKGDITHYNNTLYGLRKITLKEE